MKTYFYVIIIMFAVIYNTSCKRNSTVDENANNDVLNSEQHICGNEHLVMATLWFQRSAEMRAVYYQTFYLAKQTLENNLIRRDTASVKPPVVVLDIDETILDNSVFQSNSIRSGEEYTSERWKEWSDMANAKVLPGAIDFLLFAKSKGVKAIYISNRKIDELESTIKNMKKLGFPFVETDNFYLRTDESSKLARRNIVAEKYDIILLIGDNLTDFSEIYESRNERFAFDIVDQYKNDFGTKYIILPNPMYGEWENAIYKNSYSYTPEQKDSLRKVSLIY